jgi:hypothetical protein
MSRLTGKDAFGMFEAYQAIYSPQVDQVDEIEQLDELSDKKVQRVVDARNRQSDREDGGAGSPGKAFHRARRTNIMAARRNERTGSNVRVDPDLTREELDIFDVVLEFLQAEGYAETLEEAEWIMANVIDEEAIDIILGEAQAARENPEGHDKEEKKKYAPVRGERTPMPPRGNKSREAFEKWYAANVR